MLVGNAANTGDDFEREREREREREPHSSPMVKRGAMQCDASRDLIRSAKSSQWYFLGRRAPTESCNADKYYSCHVLLG